MSSSRTHWSCQEVWIPGVNAPVTSPSLIARVSPSAYTATYPVAPSPANSMHAAPVAPSGPIVVHVHNHYDTSVAHAAIDSRTGQTQILNVLRANPSGLRSPTGANRGR